MRKQIAGTLVTRVALLAGGVVAAIVSARFLGPEGRGQYFLVVTLAAAVVQFGNLGLASSNTYQVARDRSLLPHLLANSLWISLALGLAGGTAVAGVVVVADLFPGTPDGAVWLVVALAPPTLFFLLGTNLLVGVGRIRAYNLLDVLSQIVVVTALLLAGLLGAGAIGFVAASAVGWSIAASILLFTLTRGGRNLRFRPDVLRRGVRYAAKTYAVVLLGFLVLRSNVFLIKHFSGAHELGLYSIAAQMADALVILPTAVSIVLFPHLVRERPTGWHSTLRSCAITGAFLAAACLVVAAAAGPLVRIAFGAEYGDAVPILRLLLPGVLAVGMTTVLSQYLAAIGLPRILVAVWGAALIVAVGLGTLLVRPYEGEGAAAALSITYVVLFVLMLTTAGRYRGTAAT